MLLSTEEAGDTLCGFTLFNQLSSCHLFVGGGSGSGDALWDGSFASLSLELLSLSESDPELLSDPLWLLESSLELSAPSLLWCEGSELLPGVLLGIVLSQSCSPSLSSLLLSFKSSFNIDFDWCPFDVLAEVLYLFCSPGPKLDC